MNKITNNITSNILSKNMNKSEAERKFLIAYTVMALAFLAAGVSAAMAFPMFLGTVPEVIFCWGIYRFQKGNGTSRAVIMTVSGLVTMTFFGVMVLSMDILIPLFAILIAMIGMFNSNRLLDLWAADAALIFLYHLSVRKSYDLDLWDTYLRIFYQVVCLSLMLYLEKAMIQKNIERKRQMSGMIEFLQESERGRDDFLSGFLCGLRMPLDDIRSKSELILKWDVSDEVSEAVESILASERQIRESAEGVSDYVEAGSGKGALREETYSLEPLLQDVIAIIHAQNASKKVEIILECDENVPRTMVGDSDSIRKAIMCLLNNALKFTGKKSFSLKVSAQKKNYGVNLCVGIGDMGGGFRIVIPQRMADGQEKECRNAGMKDRSL